MLFFLRFYTVEFIGVFYFRNIQEKFVVCKILMLYLEKESKKEQLVDLNIFNLWQKVRGSKNNFIGIFFQMEDLEKFCRGRRIGLSLEERGQLDVQNSSWRRDIRQKFQGYIKGVVSGFFWFASRVWKVELGGVGGGLRLKRCCRRF